MCALRWLGLILLSLLLALVLLVAHTWWFKPLRLNWFYNRVFLQSLVDSPISLSSLQLLDGSALDWYSGRLDDFSIAHEDQEIERAHLNSTLFQSYDAAPLTGPDKVSWQVADFQNRLQREQENWRWYSYPVNPLFGVQSQLPDFLINTHAITNEKSARRYLARLNAIPKAYEQIEEGLKVREAKGLLPNQFAVQKTTAQIEAFLEPAPRQHPLVLNLEEKLKKITPALPAERQDLLIQQASEAVEKSVYPTYQKMRVHLQNLQNSKKHALNNDGAWAMPNGEAYYNFLIWQHTTTHLSAQDLHQKGLEEVARIGREMDAILAQEQVPGKTRADKMQSLAHRSDQLYPDTPTGREQLLLDYQRIIDEVDAASKSVFGLRPQMGVVVKRVPEFSEKTAPMGYYQPPSLEGERPGQFFTNLYKIEDTPKFGMHTLAYHEAIPGHHLQIALQMKMTGLPFFRRAAGFSAFVEGWALYAERLAWEMGLEKEPLDNLGRLQGEMFRAVRLVVDTGLHAKHWTREQAIAYMMRETGMGETEVTVEIERYLINPGQALAYKVGMMKILELRERAKAQLGPRFKLSEFHDLLLSNGALPLDVLDSVVNDWIRAQ